MTVEVEVGASNPVKIMANIFISFIGAGVLGLPYAFKEAGILEGVTIMSIVGILSMKSMLLLIDCKYKLIQKTPGLKSTNALSGNGHTVALEKVPHTTEEKVELVMSDSPIGEATSEEPNNPPAPGMDLTYGDVAYHAIGHPGRVLVDITIVVSQIGFCCSYIIFIAENLNDYIKGLRLIHWLFILLPPLACLTFLRQLNSLAISSLLAQLSNLLAWLVVFWFDFKHFSTVKIHPKEISLKGFPFFLAVSIYCYEGAGMILSLEASLAEHVRHKFTRYFRIVLFIVTTLCISFGVCGYLSFGPYTNPIITLNLPKGSSLDFAMVVKSCLCLALFFTYPVMMFPVIRILEKKIISNPKEDIWKGNILRLLMVIVTGIVVMAIPNFANLMALIGATCCCLLAFILPGLLHLRIFKGSATKCQVAVDLLLISIGLVGAILGTMDALVRLHETHTAHHHHAPEFFNTTLGYDNTTVAMPKRLPAPHFIEAIFSNLKNDSLGISKGHA